MPTTASSVVIPAVSSQRYPQVCGTARCDSLLLRTGASLRLGPPLTVRALTSETGSTIYVDGDLTISGPVDCSGRMEGSNLVTLTGSGAVRGQFQGLRLNATDRTFTDVNVEGDFEHSGGILRVVFANFQRLVDLHGSNVISASSTSRLIVGDVIWNTSSSVTDPPRQIDVYGSWSATRFLPTAGRVSFHGSSSVNQIGAMHDVQLDGTCTFIAPLVVGGNVTLSAATVTGDLDIQSAGATITVSGTVTINRDLYVRDDASYVVGSAASVLRVLRDFECSGHYELAGDLVVGRNLHINPSATFTPTDGRIVFNGPGTRTMTSTTTQPQRARPNTVVVQAGATLQMQSILDVGSLQVSGVVQVGVWNNGSPAPNQRFARDVQVATGGTFTYGDTAVPFRVGNLTVAGTATVPGATLVVENNVVVNGTFNTDSGSVLRMEQNGNATGTFRSVVVAGGQRTLLGAVVQGNLTHTGGTLRVGQGRVVGSFASTGASVADNGSASDLLIVSQNVNLATTGSTSAPPAIRLGGNWQSSPTFQPVSGAVGFVGTGAVTAASTSGAIAWHHLEVAATTDLTLTGDLLAESVVLAGRLTTNGSVGTLGNFALQAGSNLRATTARVVAIGGNLTVAGAVDAATAELGVLHDVQVSGRLSVGAGVHRIGGSFDATGALAFGGGSLVSFFGTGRIRNAPTAPFPNVEIGGSYGLDAVYVAGAVTQLATSSGLDVVLAEVGGSATFFGGRVLDGASGSGRLLIGGDATFAGVAASPTAAPPEIECHGNWTANAAFAPDVGRVVLAGGSGRATLAATDNWLGFHEVIVQRPCAIAGHLGMTAAAIHLEPGGSLDIGSRVVQLYCDVVDCRGDLAVGLGGQLRCGPLTVPAAQVFVAAGGSLRVVGAPGAPAVLRGTGPGSFLLGVAGRLDANEYEFRDMAPQGVILFASATLGAPPLDLRGGVFGSGAAAAGATLLEIERNAAQPPLVLTDIEFDNFPATARYNVRARSNGRITLAASNGNFFGAEFEDDPNGVVDWLPFARSEATFTAADGGLRRVRLAFATTREVDAATFAVWRGESASGPAPVLVGTVVATGAPGSYEIVDPAPRADRRNYYFLVETLRRGVGRVLATTSANALPPSFAAVRVVGPGGFADIGAALAAGPGVTVLVESGVYPPFRIAQSAAVRALPGAEVRIDASSGPVVVEAVAGDAGLHGLTIVATTGPALVVRRCPSLLVLDGLHVQSAAPAGALQLSDCAAVVLQRCDVSGAVTACVRSVVAAWGGSLAGVDLADHTQLTNVGLAAGQVNVDATSSVRSLPGTVPVLDGPTTWHDGASVPQVLRSDPGSLFVYLYSIATGFYDLRALAPVDMFLLLGIESLGQPLFSGVVGASGEVAFAVPVPSAPELWGLTLNTQVLALGLRAVPGRFGTTQRVIITP